MEISLLRKIFFINLHRFVQTKVNQLVFIQLKKGLKNTPDKNINKTIINQLT